MTHGHGHGRIYLQVRASRADATHAPEPTSASTAARRLPPAAPWEVYVPACLATLALHAAAALLLLPLPWWWGASPFACLVAALLTCTAIECRSCAPGTYGLRVPASCVPYLPRTVAPQVLLMPLLPCNRM